MKLLRLLSTDSPILPLILATHARAIPRPLPTLPKATSLLPNKDRVTNTTILRPVVTLSGAETANHAIGMFIGMFLDLIVAAVTRIDLVTTTEAKPAITLCIVTASASFGQFLTSHQAEGFFFAAGGGAWEM